MKPIQCHAAVLLAAGKSQFDVATQLNIHPETIRNWTKKRDFQAMLASETQIALEKLRNSSSDAFLGEIARIKKCEQNHAPTSTQHEKARTGDVARAGPFLPVQPSGGARLVSESVEAEAGVLSDQGYLSQCESVLPAARADTAPPVPHSGTPENHEIAHRKNFARVGERICE